MAKKTVLITGCSTGFGKLAAKTFQAKGWNVIATMRKPEKETELTQLDDVLVTRLDVTDDKSVAEAVEKGLAKFGSIDVLVNNAGIGGAAIFEQYSEEAIRSTYETNVFGVMRVSRAVLPHMRKQKEGCIINVTSVAGMFGAPGHSIYSSTKYAVEGLSEAMALEYKPFNIKVKTVAPGGYETAFKENADTDSIANGSPELVGYARALVSKIEGIIDNDLLRPEGAPPADPQEVADKIYECATTETPINNPVGLDAQMLIQMRSSLPPKEFIAKLEELLLPETCEV